MREKRADFYQITLIVLAVAITGMFGIFVYRELFPEYKVYQNRYQALEELRSEETGVPPAPFRGGVQQIVIAEPDKGPETIDRCISCHVALKLGHFSPTKVAHDVNGEMIVDEHGVPVRIPNDEYVWGKIDERIAELMDPAVLARLEAEGNSDELRQRKREAEELEEMKKGEIHGHDIDMTKVLAMHPLIGRESRPFQYHSMEDFGCTACHSGNGRGLTTARAHGPVLDGQYHSASHGPKPKFLEEDPENDPLFSKVFNDMPGHDLLFQTTPLYVGAMMEAKCVQCHLTGQNQLRNVAGSMERISGGKESQLAELQNGMQQEVRSTSSLLALRVSLEQSGFQSTVGKIREGLQDLGLTPEEEALLEGNLSYLSRIGRTGQGEAENRQLTDEALAAIDRDLYRIVGSSKQVSELTREVKRSREEREASVRQYLEQNPGSGSFAAKKEAVKSLQTSIERLAYATEGLRDLATEADRGNDSVVSGAFDEQLHAYARGGKLFVSQACYACHQLNGLSRGGVGPELSDIGLQYPWYVKESITWPQGNLPTSTMPNFKLDHEEVEDLMAFLMAQRGEDKTMAEVDRALTLKEWAAGKPMSWEKPVPAGEVNDVREGMIVFATQGCSSCHKLKGYDSHVGFLAEKKNPSFQQIEAERNWFREVFPEAITGAQIVAAIEEHGSELQNRVAAEVHEGGLLEEIERRLPDGVSANLANFKYAFRAKNASIAAMLSAAQKPGDYEYVEKAKREWNEQVHQVMMLYVQEYGLGRNVGPNLHWSGVYRDEQWLVEHFRKPTMHVAKSIMPAMPFDDTKFYQLTHMLQQVGADNRDYSREVVSNRGFDPQHSYEQHCASCHGQFFHGNGPVARWIYPIPKNLRNPTFMRNLTRERAINSIVHGVRGTPMAPWGEDLLTASGEKQPVLSRSEIEQLVDWLFLALPGGRVIESDEDVQKWQYKPEDFLKELEDQGVDIESEQTLSSADRAYLESVLPTVDGYYASLQPSGYTPPEGAVSKIFAAVPNSSDETEGASYYIRKEFYTPENLAAGEGLFLANCSHCHGKEGGGNGDRAITMVDAKPRMLTNLPWLETRDDLRLLRSIKYGVAGTSMTPWGDKTSAIQRLQLVTYIRSLTAAKLAREKLNNVLYATFESASRTVIDAQAWRNGKTRRVEQAYESAKRNRERAFGNFQEGETSANRASEIYEKELSLLKSLKEQQAAEAVLAELGAELQREQKVYTTLGSMMVDWSYESEIYRNFLDLVRLNSGRYSFDRGELKLTSNASAERKLLEGSQGIDRYLQAEQARVAEEEKRLNAQLPSPERIQGLADLKEKRKRIEKLRKQVLSSFKMAAQSRRTQQKLFEAYSAKLREEI